MALSPTSSHSGTDTTAIHTGDAVGGDLAGAFPNPTIPNGAVAYADLAAATKTSLAGSEIDYVEITANVACTATTAATANTVITSSAKAYDGSTIVLIEFWCPDFIGSLNTIVCSLQLYEDGTDIGRLWDGVDAIAAGNAAGIYAKRRMTPTNATHTYTVRGWVSAAGTFTVRAGAGGAGTNFPAGLRIVRAAAA